MITCRELIDFLHDYVDGALPAAQRVVFEDHLKICPDCVDYVGEYRRTIRAAASTKDAGETPLPDALVRAILAARSKRS